LSAFHPIATVKAEVEFGWQAVIQAPKPEPRIMRYELSDYEWAAIKPVLPNKPRGVPRVNERRVLNGIFWVLRSGAPWRDLPENLMLFAAVHQSRLALTGQISFASFWPLLDKSGQRWGLA
jgi:hypothetical protein